MSDFCKTDYALTFLEMDFDKNEAEIEQCVDLMKGLRQIPDSKSFLERSLGEDDNSGNMIQDILEIVEESKKTVADEVTVSLMYYPQEYGIKRMFSSAFSHADWEHLIFNLVFFLAFSIAVELSLGSFLFAVFIAFTCVVKSLVYSYGGFGLNNSLPSLGLSGVVFGVMAFSALVYPLKFSRCFYWIIIVMGVVRVPALLLVGAYIGVNYYDVLGGSETNTNYLAHLGGAAAGFLAAIFYILVKALKRMFRNGRVIENT
ncbi:MAG: rhomboid family intramembrane serine protease [Cellvibrionaceae bacterium]